jgi:hypothetical protein
MNKEINVFVQLMKDEIQTKFGRSIFYANDCQELSELIKHQTKRTISPSTLKRFFGIIKAPFAPSIYTHLIHFQFFYNLIIGRSFSIILKKKNICSLNRKLGII